jgi:hypothetical protein
MISQQLDSACVYKLDIASNMITTILDRVCFAEVVNPIKNFRLKETKIPFQDWIHYCQIRL